MTRMMYLARPVDNSTDRWAVDTYNKQGGWVATSYIDISGADVDFFSETTAALSADRMTKRQRRPRPIKLAVDKAGRKKRMKR